MICVYCFYPGDEDQALKNAKWINELGGCHGHELLSCYDPRCAPETVEQIRQELAKSFDKLHRCPADSAIDGWPEGANYFFRLTAAWLQDKQHWPYYLWIEPDAIPMVPGWMDTLEAEYKRAGKLFMGDRVQVNDIPLHMSGVGIYPNPLHAHAGEAYRAHDIAWDMAAKDQIVPKAHFTKLIEHAWQHPTFGNQGEIATQIATETILFHSSKDGSLIDLLRQKAAPELNYNSVPTEPTSGSPSREEIGPRAVQPPIYDIFIRTYPGDYEWLNYCLLSIDKFVKGFRKIWIISPTGDKWLQNEWSTSAIPMEWEVMNDETTDGYLAQQITKLYADVITDYQPDYILHVDSDVIFTRDCAPLDFFQNGKPIWYYTPYSVIQTPWQPVIEKFMGFPQPYEFMRRLPIMVPKWLYPRLREFCRNQHNMVISDYIKMQPMRAFSEFNALGAYAYFHYKNEFHFRHTQESPMPEPFARQFHSWSSLTPEVKTEIETILGGDARCSIPPEDQQRNAAPTVQPAGAAIKVLPSGIWVLEGDQISQWVEQEGRLDHDQNLLPHILKHISKGDTVVDAGAFIGDHTIAYSDAVGEDGEVYAYEPNPLAFECLEHNTQKLKNVFLANHGLGDDWDSVNLSGNNGNYGGCYVGDHMPIDEIRIERLDKDKLWMDKVDFIKIDVEGYELKVLDGAKGIINACHPKMVIEVNIEALRRQGENPVNLFKWLEEHQYEWSIMQENCSMASPLYDILCLPTPQPPEVVHDAPPEIIPASAPVANLSTAQAVQLLVNQLQEIAEVSPGNKAIVASRLVFAGLRPVLPKKGKKNGNKNFKWKRQRTRKKHQPERTVDIPTEGTPT